MSPDEIARIRASWTLVVPIAESLAARFYDRLFALDPSLRPLFAHADPAAQRRKLVQALAVVVAGIEQPAHLLPAVQALGRRHAAYGVEARHYDTVGDALLWTLRRALGVAFDDATRRAWAAAYALLADAMRSAASDRAAPVRTAPASVQRV